MDADLNLRDITSTQGPVVTWLVWLRLAAGGIGIFAGFIGVFAALASATNKYGFHWTTSIIEIVRAYRQNIYPLYDDIFGILSNLCHVRLVFPAALRDPLTVVQLAFLSACSESMIRDKQNLFMNAVRGGVVLFHNVLDALGKRIGGEHNEKHDVAARYGGMLSDRQKPATPSFCASMVRRRAA